MSFSLANFLTYVAPPTFQQLVLPAASVLAIVFQQGQAASDVGAARKKYQVLPPHTTGNPDFDRAFRAQQNGLEFLPLVLPVHVIFTCFGAHYLPGGTLIPAGLGFLYAYFRHQYLKGYQRDAAGRLAPFKRCLVVLKLMLIGASFSLAKVALGPYIAKYVPQ
eukprot:Colp12_sorted_trinity150504_noHs@24891